MEIVVNNFFFLAYYYLLGYNIFVITWRGNNMQIIYSDAYKKDYKKIIKNKHLHKEELRIENIKNVIISSENLH